MRAPLTCHRRGRRINLSTTSEQLFLRRCYSCFRIYANKLSRAAFVFKLNHAVNQRKQSVILASSDIAAGFPLGTALTRQNVAAEHPLASKFFQAQPLRV